MNDVYEECKRVDISALNIRERSIKSKGKLSKFNDSQQNMSPLNSNVDTEHLGMCQPATVINIQ